jgi:DNA-binding CsgD family transcriptional regulator
VNDATPEARLLDEEPRALVRHLIGQSDEVLSRVIYGEQTWEEIAAELGISRSTVQARVRRAYAVLWARLRRRRAAARFPPHR